MTSPQVGIGGQSGMSTHAHSISGREWVMRRVSAGRYESAHHFWQKSSGRHKSQPGVLITDRHAYKIGFRWIQWYPEIKEDR